MRRNTIMKKFITLILSILIGTSVTEAQLLEKLGKKAQKAAERTVERRIEKETSKKTDEALDKVFEPGKTQKEGSEGDNPHGAGNAPNSKQADPNAVSSASSSKTLAAYSKFDFIPGEKIIAVEDFSQDAVGDFPAKWNTDASGEVVTLDGTDGNWLALTASGTLTPDFIKFLPDNFTLEFDLAVSPTYSFYDQPLLINIVSLRDANNFTAWGRFGNNKHTGVVISLHPQDAGSKPLGQTAYQLWVAGKKTMENKANQLEAFNIKDKNLVRVSMWRQNQRFRVYLDETKIWDLPRAFDSEADYNSLVFSRHSAKDGNNFYVSNIRLAVGAPDTRSKLITEGKFSTTGIHFNTGSAIIKPESFGVLKEIATILTEHADVTIDIIGHTDGDGAAGLNLNLSKQRAESVKNTLHKEFGIAANRMETDGKGDTEPVGDNETIAGKAMNRRVEFVKR
jgi:OmpA-OmpF porin, OOP family